MAFFRRNGAQLAWLLFPAERALERDLERVVEIWSTPGDGAPVRLEPAFDLYGGHHFPCLRIDLADGWQV